MCLSSFHLLRKESHIAYVELAGTLSLTFALGHIIWKSCYKKPQVLHDGILKLRFTGEGLEILLMGHSFGAFVAYLISCTLYSGATVVLQPFHRL